ncbi:MAG: hypothetical protein IIT36_01585 [Aeriscardovia sp.]|nr:hypothetical protein [Aeriscardovia sp.]
MGRPRPFLVSGFGRIANKREWRYIKREYPLTNNNIDAFDIAMSAAVGKGIPKRFAPNRSFLKQAKDVLIHLSVLVHRKCDIRQRT